MSSPGGEVQDDFGGITQASFLVQTTLISREEMGKVTGERRLIPQTLSKLSETLLQTDTITLRPQTGKENGGTLNKIMGIVNVNLVQQKGLETD